VGPQFSQYVNSFSGFESASRDKFRGEKITAVCLSKLSCDDTGTSSSHSAAVHQLVDEIHVGIAWAVPQFYDQKRTFGRQVLAKELRRGPKIDVHSVAHKINISALDISPDQLYAQLVSNICSLLSLCQ
jgi:hypothetical protein